MELIEQLHRGATIPPYQPWDWLAPVLDLERGCAQAGIRDHRSAPECGRSGEAGVGYDIWLNKRLTPETIAFAKQKPSFRGACRIRGR
jgi:hypothetical protein